MKNRLGLVSLALWVLTIGVFAFFFVRGTTSVSTDQRRSVNLSPIKKNLILGEMRTMLKAINGMLGALSDGDMSKAAEAATSAGMAMAVDASPILMAKLPLDFKELGMGTHKAFDDLSSEIKKGATVPQVLVKMHQITNRCIACHETNRLGSITPKFDGLTAQFAFHRWDMPTAPGLNGKNSQ
jgi:hypothetical protein